MARCIFIVVTALMLPALASGQEKVCTRESDLVRGRELLSAQQWDQAAEIYGRRIHDLPRAVDEVWSVHDGKGDAERNRYRFRLLHFLFNHAAHSAIGWNSHSNVILRHGRSYAEFADTATKQLRDWQAKAAADSLGQCGGAEVAALEKALADGPVNRSWLIYALGKTTSPKALPILLLLAEREMGSETNNFAYAISLHGAHGKKALTQIAASEGHSVRIAAQQRLKQMSEPPPPPPSPPKAGSLPRNLKEVVAGS